MAICYCLLQHLDLYTVLSPLLGYTVKNDLALIQAQYVLIILTVTFLALQGFFNFCIYIRPRLMRLWRDERQSFCVALKLAVLVVVKLAVHDGCLRHDTKSVASRHSLGCAIHNENFNRPQPRSKPIQSEPCHQRNENEYGTDASEQCSQFIPGAESSNSGERFTDSDEGNTAKDCNRDNQTALSSDEVEVLEWK